MSWAAVSLLAITAPAAMAQQLPEVKIPFPTAPVQVTRLQQSSHSHGAYVVQRGGSLLLDGSNGHVHVLAGGSVTVNGTANTIYAERGASVEVKGAQNGVYMCIGRSADNIPSNISISGVGNSRHLAGGFVAEVKPPELVMRAVVPPAPAANGSAAGAVAQTKKQAPPPAAAAPMKPVESLPEALPIPPLPEPAPAPAASVSAAPPASLPVPPPPAAASAPPPASAPPSSFGGAMGLLAAGDSALALFRLLPGGKQRANMPQTVLKTDSRNPLKGAWGIKAATVKGLPEGTDPSIGGTIYFFDDGIGWLDAEVGLAGQRLPRIGGFKWKATRTEISISPDEASSSKWKRVENETDKQTAQYESEDGLSVKLELVRK